MGGREGSQKILLNHTLELGFSSEAQGETPKDFMGKNTGRSLSQKTMLVTCGEFSEREGARLETGKPVSGCFVP